MLDTPRLMVPAVPSEAVGYTSPEWCYQQVLAAGLQQTGGVMQVRAACARRQHTVTVGNMSKALLLQ
jgi:hypothetical protein